MLSASDLDEAAILELNAESERETSRLDMAGLRALLGQAFHVGLCDLGRDGFLIALAQDADYRNENFRWFAERHRRFVYVDRIVVARHARGRGLARRLYQDLFAAAEAAGQATIGCEINLEPPNPASEALHHALGFTEVGRRRLTTGKLVRYLARRTGP